MAQGPSEDISELLDAVAKGHQEAKSRLYELAYPRLKAIAVAWMRRERPDHTLQPTALVHEAYLRLTEDFPSPLENRSHFFRVAAGAMRRVLVEHARKHAALKRGGGWKKLYLSATLEPEVPPTQVDVLALEEALQDLRRFNPDFERIVELRIFGHFTMKEIAEELEKPLSTVEQYWSFAKAWLNKRLTERENDNAS